MSVLKQQRANIITGLILALCVVWYFKATVLGPVQWLGARRDFIHYWEEGRTILSRQSPYASTAWFYPPLTAFAMVPFAFTDYLTARWIWFLMSHTFLLIAAWLMWRATG